MKKRVLTFSILLLLTFTQVKALEFPDAKNSKNINAINYLVSKNVLSGYQDGTFRPNQEVNRAELLKILVAGLGVENLDDYQNCFPDVKEEWFAPYVCYAKSQNWINGYPDGTFKPSDTVKKVEAIKMLVNSQGYNVPQTANDNLFVDVKSSDWFAPFVQLAKEKNILEETSLSLSTEANMTREKISEYVFRALYIHENNLEFYSLSNIISSSSQASSTEAVCELDDWICTNWSYCDASGNTTRECTSSCNTILTKPTTQRYCQLYEKQLTRTEKNIAEWKLFHEEMISFAEELSTKYGEKAWQGLDELNQIEEEFLEDYNYYIDLRNKVNKWSEPLVDYEKDALDEIENNILLLRERVDAIPTVWY